jgi:hypothetical protein
MQHTSRNYGKFEIMRKRVSVSEVQSWNAHYSRKFGKEGRLSNSATREIAVGHIPVSKLFQGKLEHIYVSFVFTFP